MLENFQHNKQKYLKEWLNSNEFIILSKKYDISKKEFETLYGIGIIDYIESILNKTGKIGNCPSMKKFLLFIKYNQIELKLLYNFCIKLRSIIITSNDFNTQENAILLEIFDKNFYTIVDFFENNRNQLLKLKDNFISIASHELRTPLTSIKGYLSMIIDGDIGKIDNEVKIYLNQVFNSTNKLIQLIGELLDLKQLDSENQDFYIEKINIKTLITNLYDEYKILAEQKSQSFILDIDYNDLIIKTDETKLKQVIVNLLSNSIKYTPEGGKIHISSFQKNNKLVILFKDNGYGINEKNHQILFDDFTRIKTEDTKHIEGTGLGLPIVKKIVEKLNGTIDVKSKEGKGSEFILIFNI